jgi:hypothetical protein
MLFTGGVGILIYQNIGAMGHVLSIISLSVLTAVCFWYVFRHSVPYTHGPVKAPTPYYDYIVLLGSLLFISVQGYLQFQFGWLDKNLGWSTLVTATFFFYIAYRFDHIGILSLAITALASFWSIQLSPQKWYTGEFFTGTHLYITAIIFSTVLTGIALALDKQSWKQHFTFAYLNFCLLIFFGGSITGLFDASAWLLYVLLIYGGCVFAYYQAKQKKSFLFLLYAFLAAYIATTYFFAETIFKQAVELWFFYSILSCGGFVYFIVKYRNHFTQHP